jgi:hypothetical protein
LAALNTSLHQPLPFILEKLGYDLDAAAENLLHLSIELDEGERSLTRRRVEIALRLPSATERHECGAKATQASSRLNGHHHDVGVLAWPAGHGAHRIRGAHPGNTSVDPERADSNKRLRWGSWMVKCVLVCRGFIGSHLVKRLKRAGFLVREIDFKHNEFSEMEADDFIIGDLREQSP